MIISTFYCQHVLKTKYSKLKTVYILLPLSIFTFVLLDRCGDGQCVSISVMCDHIPDCADKKDENCGLYTVNIRIQVRFISFITGDLFHKLLHTPESICTFALKQLWSLNANSRTKMSQISCLQLLKQELLQSLPLYH